MKTVRKEKKKLLLMVLMLLSIMIIMLPVAVNAEDEQDPVIIASGYCGDQGDNVTWEIYDTGIMIISGKGNMADYGYDEESESYIWPEYNQYGGNVKHIVVEEGITSIGNSAFGPCYDLETVELPTGLLRIGSEIFGGKNYGVKSLKLPDSVTMIENRAFFGCMGLESINIPSGIKSIPDEAFTYCYNLKSINIPENVKSIGKYAFNYCNGLSNVNLPKGLESIGAYAFDGCYEISNIYLSYYLNYIGEFAFNECHKLESVEIPGSIKSVEAGTFHGCTGLKSVTIDEGIVSIGSSAFSNCTNVEEIKIPSGTKSIGDYAFNYCAKLSVIRIPSSVVSIGGKALANCDNINVYCIKDSYAHQYAEDNSIAFILVDEEGNPLEEQIIANGICGADGDNLTWTLGDRGTLVVSGSGEMQSNNSADGSPFYTYRGKVKKVVIEEKATTIGNYTFYGCTGLTEVTIPETVQIIGSYAFCGCTGLTEVTIPASVTSIWQNAFNGCTGLRKVNLNRGLQTINYSAFLGCTSLAEIILPSSLEKIGYSVFRNCSSLESISIPKDLDNTKDSYLESYAPFANSGLKSVSFAEGTTLIDYGMFAHCKNLESIDIPDGITSIGTGAFYGCCNLKTVKLPKDVIKINGYAFTGTVIESINIPKSLCNTDQSGDIFRIATLRTVSFDEGIEHIPSYMFQNCTGLETITIPKTVQTIGSYAFSGCTGLTKVTLNEDLETINQSAFSNCTALTEITLPSSLKKIGNSAFYGCTSLRSINIPKDLERTSTSYFSSYAPFAYSGIESISFAAGTTFIRAGMFAYCQELKNVLLPDTVTSIGADAFYGSNLISVEVPASLCNSDQTAKAFEGSSLQTVTFGKDISLIPSYMFYGCSKLTSAEIPDTVTTIGKYAFRSCTSMETIEVPASVETIGEAAFSGCNKLTTVELKEGLKSIGYQAFYNCSKIASITLPSTLEALENYAFYGCSELKRVVVPDKLQEIGSYSFYGCSGLTQFDMADGLKTIGSYALGNCSSLTELRLPADLASIGNNAFNGCSEIKKIIFSSISVPPLNNYKLSGMSKLEEIYVPAGSYYEYADELAKYISDSIAISTDFYAVAVRNVKAVQIFGKSVVLNWDDHPGTQIVKYVIYVNGEESSEDGSPARVTGLETGEKNTIQIYGQDEAGRKTVAAGVDVTPLAPEIISIATDSETEVLLPGKVKFTVTVKDTGNLEAASDTDDKISGFLQFKNADSGETVLTEDLTRDEEKKDVFYCTLDLKDATSGNYTANAVMTDPDDVSGSKSLELELDASKPAPLKTFNAIGNTNCIDLSWTIAVEANSTGYRIYRKSSDEEDFAVLKTINGRNNLSYTDSSMNDDKVYTYYIVALGKYGQEGEPSAKKSATRSPDTEKPVILNMTPEEISYLRGVVTFNVKAKDNVAVDRVELFYSTDDGESWTPFEGDLDTVSLGSKVSVKAVAYDFAENASDPLVCTYNVDNVGPAAVTGIEYTATDVSVTLKWNDVGDDDRSYFVVEQLIGEEYQKVADNVNTLGAYIYNLTPETEYTYRVVCYDSHGNRGDVSESITVQTTADKTAPVITSIQPPAGEYSDSLEIVAKAKDEYNVKSVTVQISADGASWKDIKTEEYEDISTNRTLRYTYSVDDADDGDLYVRALAKDSAGNESDKGDDALLVQYEIDKTAPSAPEKAAANGYSGCIEVSWKQGAEDDIESYSVYRSESEDGEFELIKSGLSGTKLIDRGVEPEVVWFYKINARDKAGNTSEFSAIVSAEADPDTTVPEIISIDPADGSSIGASAKTVSVWASDNSKLKSVLIEYSTDGTAYSELISEDNLDASDYTLAGDIPLEGLYNGASVYIRASAQDYAGLVSEKNLASYVVDLTPPEVRTASATYKNDGVVVKWTGGQENDLSGYNIYRKIAGKSFSLIKQVAVNEEGSSYSYTDKGISDEAISYVYKVEAFDECGNSSSYTTDEVNLPDRSAPTAVINCESILEVDAEYYIDASLSTDNKGVASYQINFGDGTDISTESKPIHIYRKTGTFLISLKVTDEDGNESWTSKEVHVKDGSKVGMARIHIVDDDGHAVSNANVYFDLSSDDQVVKKTDSLGNVTFTADAGMHKVGCIIPDNQWLPVKKDIIITAGADTDVTMILERHEMVSGRFEVERMTLDDIKAAGIDINDPDNQYYVKVTFYLLYEDYEYADQGIVNLKTGKSKLRPIRVREHYIWPTPLIGGGGPGGGYGGGGSGGGGDSGFGTVCGMGWLVIPVEVSTLKEFFNVDLIIENNAGSDFSMLNNSVSLNVPDGLTVMDTLISEPGASVMIPEIKGQTSETITWVVRGDEPGDYNLSADYEGILSDFNEPIRAQFKTEEPIKVYALTNMKLNLIIPTELRGGQLYYCTALTNEGDIDVYRPRVDADDILLESKYYDASKLDISTIDKETYDGLEDLNEELDVLPPGYGITRYYKYDDETDFEAAKQRLVDYYYEVEKTYGLKIKITTVPLSYFNILPHHTVISRDGNEKSTTVFEFNPYEEIEDLVKSKDSSTYNPRLAHFLCVMAEAAYDKGTKDTLNSNLDTLKFDEERVNELYEKGNALPAYTIAKKELSDGSSIVMVTIRGTQEAEHWISNLQFNTTEGEWGYHVGFNKAKEEVYEHLKAYLGGIPKNNVTYVITGHSLGAATANLLSLKLTDEGVPKENVYDYNFACPDVARGNAANFDWNLNGQHSNMFNIADARDPISFVPGVTLNVLSALVAGKIGRWDEVIAKFAFPWGKYGVSFWYSYNWNDLDKVNLDLVFDEDNVHTDGENYTGYFSRLDSSSKFKTWIEVKSVWINELVKKAGEEVFNKVIHIFLCPVDVMVYDSSGKLIASVVNNEPNYYDSTFGEIIIIVDGDQKIICLPAGEKYDIRLVGTDSGEMSYAAVEANLATEELETEKLFESVELTDGKKMKIETDEKDVVGTTKLFVIDDGDNIIKEVQTDGSETIPIDNADVSRIDDKTYTGSAITQSPVVKLGDTTLVENIDYELTYENNVNVGTGTVIITGIGNYSGNISKTFKINAAPAPTPSSSVVTPTAPSEIVDLPAVKISKPQAGKKKVTVKWKKVSNKNQKKIQGIDIQVATDKGFKNIVKSTTAGKKKTSKKIKGLKSKTKYWIRIRAYKNAADGKHVSAWKVKTVKVK